MIWYDPEVREAVSTRTRLLALTAWVIAAVLAVIVSRCVRLHSAEPPKKPLGDADLHELHATLAASQVDLPEDAARVLRENLWDLYY